MALLCISRLQCLLVLVLMVSLFNGSSAENKLNCVAKSHRNPIVFEGLCDEVETTELYYKSFDGFAANFTFSELKKGFVSDHDLKISAGSCDTIIRCIDEEEPIFIFKNRTSKTHNILRGNSFRLSISKAGKVNATDGEATVILPDCAPALKNLDVAGQVLEFKFMQLPATNVKIELPSNVQLFKDVSDGKKKPEDGKGDKDDVDSEDELRHKLDSAFTDIGELVVGAIAGGGIVLVIFALIILIGLSSYMVGCCKCIGEKKSKKKAKPSKSKKAKDDVIVSISSSDSNESVPTSYADYSGQSTNLSNDYSSSNAKSVGNKVAKRFGTTPQKIRVPPLE